MLRDQNEYSARSANCNLSGSKWAETRSCLFFGSWWKISDTDCICIHFLCISASQNEKSFLRWTLTSAGPRSSFWIMISSRWPLRTGRLSHSSMLPRPSWTSRATEMFSFIVIIDFCCISSFVIASGPPWFEASARLLTCAVVSVRMCHLSGYLVMILWLLTQWKSNKTSTIKS